MLKNKLEKLLKSDEDGEKTDKKKLENLVSFVVILIITIITINMILNGKKDKKTNINATSGKQLAEETTIEKAESNKEPTNNLEEKLEDILSKIQGIGEVKVCLNYSESNEVVAMYNEKAITSNTEENDTSGGVRKIGTIDSQQEVIFEESNSEKTPITQKIVQAKIEGAIMAAKGAKDANIKTNIIQAVEAVTGLATHKIQVFEMN